MEHPPIGIRFLVLATAPAGAWFAGIAAMQMALRNAEWFGPYSEQWMIVVATVVHLWLPVLTLGFAMFQRAAAVPLIIATALAQALTILILALQA